MNFLKYISFLVFSTLFLVLLSKSLVGQTYTIPFAEKQPAWVFPLWFANGDGQKDTIYLAYDSDASEFVIDSMFGEYTIDPIGTEFFVRMGPNFRVIANDLISYSDVFSIGNIVYPFTISYDVKLLYSDSLPGPPSISVPKVWALLGGTGTIEDCPNIDFDGFFVALIDTMIDGYPGSVTEDVYCQRDSLVVVEGLSLMSVGLSKWEPPTGFPEHGLQNLNAWVFENSLFISVNSTEPSELSLHHVSGVLIYHKTFPPGTYALTEKLDGELDGLRGLYLLSFLVENKLIVKKLISQ